MSRPIRIPQATSSPSLLTPETLRSCRLPLPWLQVRGGEGVLGGDEGGVENGEGVREMVVVLDRLDSDLGLSNGRGGEIGMEGWVP